MKTFAVALTVLVSNSLLLGVAHAQQPAKTPVKPPAQSKEDRAKAQHEKDIADDKKLGEDVEKEALKELKLSKDTAGLARIQRIGGELAAIAQKSLVEVTWGDARLNKFEYKFYLVEGKDVNAFSLPGGPIFVYEGLLKYVESDDELAGVLGHEISHAAFRHVAELRRRQSKMELWTLPAIIITILAKSDAAPGVVNLTSLLNQAIGSGWSVDAERASDYGGYQYMRILGKYNPVGLLTFMERLAYDEKANGTANIDWGIFRTHPTFRERAVSMKSTLETAGYNLRRSEVSSSLAFSARPNDDGSVNLVFGKTKIVTLAGPDAANRGKAIAKTLSDFFDRVPRMYDLQLNQGIFFGSGRMLFQLDPADARHAQVTDIQLSKQVLQKLKNVIYEVTDRVNAAYNKKSL